MCEDKTLEKIKVAHGTLMVLFPDVLEKGPVILDMGKAESFSCHVIFDEKDNVPSRALLCASGERWCEVKDDTGASLVVHGEYIDVYRVGGSRILIHAYGDWHGWMDTFVEE